MPGRTPAVYFGTVLRGLLVAFVFVTVTAVLGTAAIVGEFFFPGRHFCFRIGRIWSRLHLLAAGCRVRYEGHENLDRRAPCVFVSNHQSNLDIWALAMVLPLSTRVVAKASLFRIPILGGAMRSAGFISIDRSDREKAIQSLDAAHAWLRAGNPILMFAEGTRSRDGKLLPFKKGPFHLAAQTASPVVPVAVVGSWGLMPPGGLVARPGTIAVRFGDSLALGPADHEDVGALLDRARRAILDLSAEPVAAAAAER